MKIILFDLKAGWKNLFQFIPAYIFIICAEIIINILNVFTPIWWAKSFSTLDFRFFLQIFIVWISISLLDYITRLAYNRFQITIINSFQYSVHNKLLKIDAGFYLKNSSGILFSKIDRAVHACRDLLDSVTFGILPTVVRTITVFISLIFYASSIASTIAIFIVGIIILNAFLHWRILCPLEKKLINAQDTLKSRFITNINNIQLIKATLASGQIKDNIKILNNNVAVKEKRFWDINATLYLFMNIIYLFTVFIIGSYLFMQVKHSGFSAPFAIALLGAYIKGTQGILRIDRPIRTIIRSIIAIKDFYEYILAFDNSNYTRSYTSDDSKYMACGNKQNFQTCNARSKININFQNVSFAYNNFLIFNNFDFNLEIDSNQKNKICGITGPSGIGKSTFAALLSGQLKPKLGCVKINNDDISELSEIQRQNIIALHIQSSTLLDDTLKNNLLLGLPENAYNDEQLIDLLVKFELTSIFVYGNGLLNYIGNNGYNLSSGQKEKIAFINLYLRAQYFNPKIIILDEPTSHLDAQAEEMIDNIITQLSENSLVMLISHKASLLDKAFTIIDFSSANYAPKANKNKDYFGILQ